MLGLELQESLPIGWIFDSVVRGPVLSVAPRNGKTGSLVFGWSWDNASQFPFLFVYRIRFAGEEFLRGTIAGEARFRRAGGITSLPVAGAASLAEIRSDNTFQRVLYHGEVLSSEEWDWVAAAGFTLVHSYGGSPEYLR